MKTLRSMLIRWFEAALGAVFTWALYRDVKPRKPLSAGDVAIGACAFAAFLFLAASVLASTAAPPALHFAAHAKAHAEAKALEQFTDVRTP